MKRYDPTTIEPKWQKKWAESKLYEVDQDSSKQKIYATPMLPYPSGTGLHTGHVRNYSITDTVARFYRQKGYNTLTTMGWDAFGLPAENYAIKTGTPPDVSTDKNIAYFKKQLSRLGMSYDWSREFNTSQPSYYKWTQWVFALMYRRGLAYKAEKQQWWCEKCNTVLADEQVVAGRCWRHDSPDDPLINKRPLSQWFFKITDYAEDILRDTDQLDWPQKIKTMQKNWIGRSEGTEVVFKIADSDQELKVFTTRADTLFGATFMVIAPESPLLDQIVTDEQRAEVQKYVQQAALKSEVERQASKQKTGVFSGSYAINPVNQQKLPIWVADYVLGGYGTGAIMAVPGHDQRDWEFAKEYQLPILQVVEPVEDQHTKELFTGYGRAINSGKYDGLSSEQFKKQITEDLAAQGLASSKVNYKIRDWLISRQRYWGAPVPIIHCPEHGAVLVPEDQLPVELPKVENYIPDGKNSSVLAGIKDWVETSCPECGQPARRETDVMDGYVCSTWYLQRYTDPNNQKQAFDPQKADYWYPIDFYFGGDHAVAHLLYIRFFQRVLADAGLSKHTEPVKRLIYNGYINAEDGTKMSKSKGNTVDPMQIIESGYGADALRVFELFIAPYDQDTSWNQNGVPGAYRFLNRVWVLTQEFLGSAEQSSDQQNIEVDKVAHRMIATVTNDLERLSFNTAISTMMSAVNKLYLIKAEQQFTGQKSWRYALESLAQCLAPFAPHISEELWQDLGHQDSVHVDHWPSYQQKYLTDQTIKLAVQVNGKLRGEIEVQAEASEEQIQTAALELNNVQQHLKDQQPKKIIYIKNRLVNIVV